jgi:hypothetical protein
VNDDDDEEPMEFEKFLAQLIGFLAGISLFVWILYFMGWVQ